jgi:WD40 repeat protein
VGPIGLDGKYVRLDTLAYSPSGDRVASGGQYTTTCIWDSNTGELLVRLEDFRVLRSKSLVWSSDSSKLYCTYGLFAYVFDGISGTLLHRFKLNHDTYVDSIALSPTHNVLASVGACNVVQLWDTKSHQPLSGQLYSPLERSPALAASFEYYYLVHQVSFSRDGRYLASSMGRNKISLWMVKDIAPQLPVRAFMSILQCDELHSRTIHTSSLHCLASTSVLSRLIVCPPSQGYNRLMSQNLLHHRRVTAMYTTTFFG